jgi:UDP-GlcNAc:undecaprenyl-phosphate GlcNAc-1-phosphate transferase
MAPMVLILLAVSFALSCALVAIIKHVAPTLGFVDKPGHRKIHHVPKPLGGGVAIYLAIALPLLAGLAYVSLAPPPDLLGGALAVHWPGIRFQTPLAVGVLVAMTAMHLLGLRDDWRALGPYLKLVVQLLVIGTLVVGFDLRALTFMGYVPSVILTILWIAAVTNALNFLDNMDGLSAGVAAVVCCALLIAALSIGQWFVAALLALLLGALLGFLCYNFSPASIFMGDSGSLLVGLLLGVLSIRTTYLRPGQSLAAGWYSILAPVVALAVPLYDLVVVSLIRISRGKSPFVGDTNHLSHRLVARGMSRRTAVLCIYLMTAATSVGAILLAHVDSRPAAMLILIQALLVLGLVALLEQHPLPRET